ncbi:MAG: hypothetical protein PHC51_14080 [bacterium]|nr:hypothetical protein [bacterium]
MKNSSFTFIARLLGQYLLCLIMTSALASAQNITGDNTHEIAKVIESKTPGEIVVSVVTRLRRPVSEVSFTALFVGQGKDTATSLSDAESKMTEVIRTTEKEFPNKIEFIDEGGTLESESSIASSLLPATYMKAHRLLTVKSGKPAILARLIEITFAAGAKEISQPVYEAERELPEELMIRDNLLKELRAKASANASSMGVSLGDLRSLNLSEEPEPRPLTAHLTNTARLTDSANATNINKFTSNNDTSSRVALLAGKNIRLIATGIFDIRQ